MMLAVHPSVQLHGPPQASQASQVAQRSQKRGHMSWPYCATGATGACALGSLGRGLRHRARRAHNAGRVICRAADVMLVVGEGSCPWGEGGTKMMTDALGFAESASWHEGVKQLAFKLQQAVPGLTVEISNGGQNLDSKLVVLINMNPESLESCQVSNLLVLSSPGSGSISSTLLPRSGMKRQSDEVLARCSDLWSRDTAEDCFYALLFAIHFSVTSVPLVEQEPAIDSFEKVWRLCSRCLNEALEAGMDSEARACLACQSGCDVRDQTQMYRCTVSHESEALAQLVRCFERRGIFDCDAQVPDVEFDPLSSFRGKVLNHDMAWEIMEGHWSLDAESCSWRPVLGQNPAYDYFPCQYNTWYRDPRGNRGWYDPVFKVITLDGREVWRKRHYRVLLGNVPGSFQLSTEDNGISLREFWRIVDADDALTWAVFHYAGAAKSVGQSYTGSLLVTKDGLVPTCRSGQAERIRKAFEKAQVAPFELYAIQQDQDFDAMAPLTDFRHLKRYAVNA